MLADIADIDDTRLFYERLGKVARPLDSHTRYKAAAANYALGTCLPEFNVVEWLSQIEAPTLISSVSMIGSHP